MDTNGYDSYLETQIRTATPQKLQLMLIEGAQRFANETVRHWESDDAEAALWDTACRLAPLQPAFVSVTYGAGAIMGVVSLITKDAAGKIPYQVVRGGSWHDRPHRARSAFRLAYPAWQKVFNVGFRVVVAKSASVQTADRQLGNFKVE